MRPIGPHEYDYLSWPYLSSGADMLEYTLQHLCFTGALDLHYWKVAAHPKNPRPVVRLFLARGSAVVPLSTAEAFALSLVPADRPIHLGELRVRMKKEVTDAESFKFDQVRKDLKAEGLLRFTYWPSAEGRAARGRVSDQLSDFKSDLHELLSGPREKLDARLDDLGSQVVMLADVTRDQLKAVHGRTFLRCSPSAPSCSRTGCAWTPRRSPAYPSGAAEVAASAVGAASVASEAEASAGEERAGRGKSALLLNHGRPGQLLVRQ